ncbi:hypothetical protein MMC14_005955 [Varicellaria rhodocarpa]|nr:hypothetical protein [Varicellaria rhodocarpa]
MSPINRLFVRDDSSNTNTTLSPTIENLLIALLVLVVLCVLLIGALFVLRRYRKSKRRQQSELPLYNSSQSTKISNHRRLTITTTPYGRKSESTFVVNEKSAFLEQSSSPPASPVPEIRITFPEEEEDQSGKRKSGRVVVVRISDNGSYGLEPVTDEKLPSYQTSESDRFQSLDLERMGGLKEKEWS